MANKKKYTVDDTDSVIDTIETENKENEVADEAVELYAITEVEDDDSEDSDFANCEARVKKAFGNTLVFEIDGVECQCNAPDGYKAGDLLCVKYTYNKGLKILNIEVK